MSRHLTLRVSDAELAFLDRLAREKSVSRTAVARHLLLQNIALDAIKSEVVDAINAQINLRLSELQSGIDQTVRLDDLVKATNYITDRMQLGGKK